MINPIVDNTTQLTFIIEQVGFKFSPIFVSNAMWENEPAQGMKQDGNSLWTSKIPFHLLQFEELTSQCPSYGYKLWLGFKLKLLSGHVQLYYRFQNCESRVDGIVGIK